MDGLTVLSVDILSSNKPQTFAVQRHFHFIVKLFSDQTTQCWGVLSTVFGPLLVWFDLFVDCSHQSFPFFAQSLNIFFILTIESLWVTGVQRCDKCLERTHSCGLKSHHCALWKHNFNILPNKSSAFFLFSLVRNKEVKTLSTLSGCMENINGVVDTFTRSEYLPPTNPSKPYLPSVSPTESFKCSLLSPSWGWLRSRSGLRLHFHSTASFF